jgi:hypothetical protein
MKTFTTTLMLLLCSCGLDPPARLEAPQPGMPCGAAWSQCSTPEGVATGMCCPNGDACRTDGTCEPMTLGVSLDGGAARVRQRPTSP